MALPQAVQRQVDAAEALMAAGNKPEAAAPEPAETPPEPQQAPTAQAEASPEPSPAPPPQQPQRDEWQQKYQILQGKYNAEVPQLHHQVKDLTRRLNETVERMEQTAKQQETKQADQKPVVDPKDIDNFGADLVEMVQRVAQSSLGGMVAKVDGLMSGIQQRLAVLERELQGTTQTVAYTAQDTFLNHLTRAVPDWEAINADQRFLAWLSEVDPVLGATRQAALEQAEKALDVKRVIGIFRAFEATQPKPAQAKSKLDKQITPSSSASAAPVSTEKPTLTQKQISDFYKEVALGRYRGREAEQAKFEAEINLAMQEQRIR